MTKIKHKGTEHMKSLVQSCVALSTSDTFLPLGRNGSQLRWEGCPLSATMDNLQHKSDEQFKMAQKKYSKNSQKWDTDGLLQSRAERPGVPRGFRWDPSCSNASHALHTLQLSCGEPCGARALADNLTAARGSGAVRGWGENPPKQLESTPDWVLSHRADRTVHKCQNLLCKCVSCSGVNQPFWNYSFFFFFNFVSKCITDNQHQSSHWGSKKSHIRGKAKMNAVVPE